MLYFLGAWLLLAIACGITGLGWLNCWRVEGFERLDDRVIVAMWLGLVTQAIALLSASFFVALSPWVGIAIALGSVGLALALPQTRADLSQLCTFLNPKFYRTCLLIAIIAAGFMGSKVFWIDTGLYHYSAVQWLAEYGAVPGLGLLNSRLGWPSAWFALAAPFNPPLLDSRGTVVVNGFILLLAIAHWWLAVRQIFGKKEANWSDWLGFFAYPGLLGLFVLGRLVAGRIRIPATWTFVNIVVSVSQDFVVALLCVLVAWAIAVIYARNAAQNLNNRIIPLFLAAAAFAMKPTAMPLLAIATLFYLIPRPWRLQRFGVAGIVIAAFAVPTMGFGIVVSGCPLSPLRVMCWDLPWTTPLPGEVAKSLGLQDGSWQAWYGSTPNPQFYWFWMLKKWLRDSTLFAFCCLVSGVSWAVWAIIAFKQHKLRWQPLASQYWIDAIGALGLVFLTWRSPLIRFGIGYAVLIPAVLLAMVFENQARSFPQGFVPGQLSHKLRRWSLMLLWGIAGVIVLRSVILSWFWLPQPLFEVLVAPAQVNDVRYFYPLAKVSGIESREMLCWGAQLP
ncbi:MAG: hypothetical protein SAJ12_23785, partial [Jaaginema sp. PMC 1079.18]|nr:hypothetical protein [Jaaginema sp. PMC 1079.18]